jgi:DNA (cytosine-5)-methyltransferase 1
MKEHFSLNSFFSGIGGFDLAFDKAGIKPSFHCEIDIYCASILKKHWPGTPLANDIGNLDPSTIPFAEIWSGGFPCQDVSVARGSNGRKGLKGPQSGLFYKFLNLIQQKLPQIVLIENVTGLLSSHKGKDFYIILKSLTELGYGIAWRIFNTRYFGAPQSRPRVYICAWRGSVENAGFTLFESQGGGKTSNQRSGFITPSKCEITGAVVPQIAFCLAATSGRHTGTDWSRSYVSYDHGRARRLTPIECEGLQGFPIGWTIPNDDFKVANGRLDSLRYKALGNAVSVPVVQWIANRINLILRNRSYPSHNIVQQPISDEDQIIVKLQSVTKEFLKKTIRVQKLDYNTESENFKIKWKSGGCATQNICLDGPVSPAPFKPINTTFLDILEKVSVDAKYYLSPNAAEGILRRVDSQERTLFEPLRRALELLASSNNKTEKKVVNL